MFVVTVDCFHKAAYIATADASGALLNFLLFHTSEGGSSLAEYASNKV